jgi:hypothetical protein
VTVTKYQTMDKVSVAQSRLEVVRAVGDIPRYMNPERGFEDNAAFNTAVTALLDDQVCKIAQLDGDAYRQASYANIAWTLRDVGGYNSSLHKNLVATKRAATDAEKLDLSRSQGRNDQILMSLQELRGNPSTPANIAAGLTKMNESYVESFGKQMKFAKDGAVSGKYEHDVDTFFVESQRDLGSIIAVRDAFYDNAEQILGAAYSSA